MKRTLVLSVLAAIILPIVSVASATTAHAAAWCKQTTVSRAWGTYAEARCGDVTKFRVRAYCSDGSFTTGPWVTSGYSSALCWWQGVRSVSSEIKR